MNSFCPRVAGSSCSGCALVDCSSDAARLKEVCFCCAFICDTFRARVGVRQVLFDLSLEVCSRAPVTGGFHAYGAALGETGFLATLSQTLRTVSGQSYLLSFWLENPTSQPTQIFE